MNALILLLWALSLCTVVAQMPPDQAKQSQQTSGSGEQELSSVAGSVNVQGVARDEEIQSRIQNVIAATDWFTDSKSVSKREWSSYMAALGQRI